MLLRKKNENSNSLNGKELMVERERGREHSIPELIQDNLAKHLNFKNRDKNNQKNIYLF